MSSAGCAALSFARLVEERHHLRQRRERVVGHPGDVVGGEDGGIGPTAEVGSLRLGHAEQLADHQHRQRGGERLDEIDLLAARQRVEQLARERADAVLHRAQRPGRELAVEDAAPLVVPRRVEVEDRAVDPAADAQRIVDERAAARAEPRGIAADLADVVVARDRFDAGRVLEDRRLRPQPGEHVVVVGAQEEARRARVDVQVVDCAHRAASASEIRCASKPRIGLSAIGKSSGSPARSRRCATRVMIAVLRTIAKISYHARSRTGRPAAAS